MNPSILTIGKFEGIHRGHKVLLQDVARRAKDAKLKPVVVVFDPHPFKLLRDPDYKSLFTADERVKLIHETGVKHIVSYPFDADFADLSAGDFCRKVFEELHPREIIVGENYRFGRNREGDVEFLRKEAAKNACYVQVFKTIGDISTSKIREHLELHEMEAAEGLLGFPFFICGEVAHGKKLGRTLGFPTMNIYPADEKFLPPCGVYETRTLLNGSSAFMQSVTNIGLRPTVSDDVQITVETHILTLSAGANELYGKQIKVEFLRFIRPERRFASTDELKAQILQDIEELVGR